MAVAPADLKALHPEFADVADDRVQVFLDRAARFHNATQWGSKSDDGLTELACHELSQATTEADGMEPAPGAPQSDSAGGISTSYASTSSDRRTDTELSATAYGRTYLRMRRTCFPSRVF